MALPHWKVDRTSLQILPLGLGDLDKNMEGWMIKWLWEMIEQFPGFFLQHIANNFCVSVVYESVDRPWISTSKNPKIILTLCSSQPRIEHQLRL